MLQLANFRPYVTAGAAVVGASLIAVTPTVADDVASTFQQRAASIEHRVVELAASDYIANPLETWFNIPITAIQNLQPNIDLWGQMPAVIGQQVAANWVQFASQYVGDFQASAKGAVNFYTGSAAKDFVPLLNTAWGEIMAGNISQAFSGPLYQAMFGGLLIPVLDPLENIPGIAAKAVTDLGNGLTNATTIGLINFGLAYVEVLPFAFFQSLGNGLQATYNSLSAGDLLGAALNAINIPGEIVYGQVDPLTGSSLHITLQSILPGIANAMATQNAQNIAKGGNLPVAIESFLNQLITGWRPGKRSSVTCKPCGVFMARPVPRARPPSAVLPASRLRQPSAPQPTSPPSRRRSARCQPTSRGPSARPASAAWQACRPTSPA
ncbi:hypothetical protein [Mycobacterium interjectum]|uniref:hypothetical protein n=1 Tax=Mycobacterium interjectum TaxID=33895 RepID=UPI0021F3B9B6|nr:hypothetical protein [Mycobacterium interjectum]MCV7091604.1 hypothetical protein [Mycobacterium interjectum]